jgi:geranylgeranyl reductase family protein
VLRTDVAVVGAGPAGCAAAITLARAGRDVTLVDRATFPRDKCCGDGLTTAALRLLEDLGLEPAAVPSWTEVAAACVRSPSGRTVRFPLPAGQGQYAAIAPRIELDAALVDQARAVGVKVHDGHRLTGARPDGDRMTLAIDGLGSVEARFAVGADGMWSPLRKALGLATPGYLGEWHAFRQYLTGVTGAARHSLWVWFEADLLPGYAWSFPLPDGRVNVGFGVHRDGARLGREMAQVWSDLLARPHIASALGPRVRAEAPHKAWPIPARVDRAVLSDASGRALFVGDAACATDPLTGEGIGQALLTGRLAADAILAAGALQPDLAAARYRAAVAHEWLPDHRMAAALSRLLQHPRAARGAIRVAGASGWTRRSFGRWLFEDEPRAAAITPGRWHRHFLARAGAYAPGYRPGRCAPA